MPPDSCLVWISPRYHSRRMVQNKSHITFPLVSRHRAATCMVLYKNLLSSPLFSYFRCLQFGTSRMGMDPIEWFQGAEDFPSLNTEYGDRAAIVASVPTRKTGVNSRNIKLHTLHDQRLRSIRYFRQNVLSFALFFVKWMGAGTYRRYCGQAAHASATAFFSPGFSCCLFLCPCLFRICRESNKRSNWVCRHRLSCISVLCKLWRA